MKQQPKFSPSFIIIAAMLLLAGLGDTLSAQDQDAERRFWPPNFRPPSATAPARKQAAPPKYRRTSPALPKETAAARDAALGITVWLLTDSRKDSDGARILRPKTGNKTDYTAKRVETATHFAIGQKLRLSIEAPRNGYLYIVDREQYADGSFAEPQLIYPVNPAEDNRTVKGRVFEIPSVGDEPYFEVQQDDSKPALVCDWLTILVTPAPLKGLPTPVRNKKGDYDNIPLTSARVEQWERRWGAPAEQGELEGGAGQLYTTREQRAGNKQGRLTRADPSPQTVFRIAARPGQPLLVKLPLQISAR